MKTCISTFKIKTLFVWAMFFVPVLVFSQTGEIEIQKEKIKQEQTQIDQLIKAKQDRKSRSLAKENQMVFDAKNPALGQPNKQEIFDAANQKLLFLRVVEKPTKRDLVRMEELEKKIQNLCHILELEDCDN